MAPAQTRPLDYGLLLGSGTESVDTSLVPTNVNLHVTDNYQ